MKAIVAKVPVNIIGSIIGGVILFYGAKKFGGVSNKYAVAALVIAGVIVGANVQAKMKAKQGAAKSAGAVK